jgi:DNA-directed RNA polymerase
MQDRDLYLEQQSLEQEQADRGVANYFKSREGLPPSFGTPERQTISRCVHKVRDAIEDIQLLAAKGGRMEGINIWGMPVLSQDAEKLAVIAVNTLWNASSNTLTSACIQIGTQVKWERRLDNLKHTHHDLWSKIKRFKNRVTGSSFYKYRNQIREVDEPWPKHKCLWVGHILAECVLKNTDLFYLYKRRSGKGWVYCVSVDPEVLSSVEDGHEDLSLLHPFRMPMVVPPIPWTDRWTGGYLGCTGKETCHTPLLATNMYQKSPHASADDFGDHLKAVNVLQKTEWRINKRMLDVVAHVFHHNLELGGILRRDPDPLPEKPEDFSWNPKAKTRWKESARQIFRYNEAMLGARTSMLVAIDMAKRFSRYDKFYYVWYLDWRGRMSPRGGALIPQGDEVCKSMLEFYEGHELGPRGFYWLTIHMANCMGYDKEPFPERVKHVLRNAEDIRMWAKDPLTYKGWSDQDSPYMCLAAAMEWAKASLLSDPTKFVSHLPINMDGTTNGLQHLSALGRDSVGAKATNLIPTDRPNDIYSQVAGECDKIIEEDYKEWLADGAPSAESVREEICPATIVRLRRLIGSSNWRGRVTRKVTKRGTMTSPYGVSRQGIRRQLVDDGFLDFAKEDPTIDINIAADYMRDAVWRGIGEVICNARFIMEWLQGISELATDEGTNVSWRTPAGMLVDQGYLRPNRRTIQTAERKYTITVSDGERKLMARKQRNAIAPNYIHSLDASHLTRVVLRLYDMGIRDMMMIHDSYGVHACHVETMQKVIREEFVSLHSEDLLGEFRKTVQAYLESEVPEPPELGDYRIEDMLEADYAFC